MKPIRIILFSSIIAAAISAKAQSVSVATEAGGLSEALSGKTDVTSLTVSGKLNAADYKYINSDLTKLDMLNLSAVASDTLPAWSLFGLQAKQIVLPAQLKVIGKGALGAVAATEVELPQTLTQIGEAAFAGAKIERLAVPASVQVSEGAFKHCTQLRSVTWLPSVIPAEAFKGCSALAEMKFPKNITLIGSDAFESTALTEVNLSECTALTQIGEGAFAECSSLRGAALPEQIKDLAPYIFMGCTSLSDLSVSAALTAVGNYSLASVSALETVGLLDGKTPVGEIGDYALANASSVQSVKLPATLESIGTKAMSGMTSLTSIDASPLTFAPALGADVWNGLDQQKIRLTVDEYFAEDFRTADQWQLFDIATVTSAGSVTDDVVTGDNMVKAWIENNTIIIQAGLPIAEAALYDAEGRTFTRIAPLTTEATVSLASLERKVWILNVVLADRSSRSFKLAAK